jgi:hypothetical protein
MPIEKNTRVNYYNQSLDKCHVAADENEKAYSRDILDDGIIRRDLESRAFDSHIGTKVKENKQS